MPGQFHQRLENVTIPSGVPATSVSTAYAIEMQIKNLETELTSMNYDYIFLA